MYLGQASFLGSTLPLASGGTWYDIPATVAVTPQVYGSQPPASVPITPRFGTDAYSAYWAMNAPLVNNPTAVQAAILSPASMTQGMPQWIYWALGGLAAVTLLRRK